MATVARPGALALSTEPQLHPGGEGLTAAGCHAGMEGAQHPGGLWVRFPHFSGLNLSEFGLMPNCFMRHLKLCKQ